MFLVYAPAFARGWLPDGYTELSYIQSTGTQYIDTGYTFSDGNKLVLDVNPYQEESTFFGANSSGKEFLLGRGSIYFGGNILTDTNQFVQNKRYNIIADMNGASSSLVVDGNILFSGNASFNSKKIFLGGIEAFSADSTVTRFVALKIYGFKVYQNNTLVQNLIPAKNPSGVVGMYDTVSGTFFTNQGTGTFTAGPTLNPCRNLFDMNWLLNASGWTKSGDVYSGRTDNLGTYLNNNQNLIAFEPNTQYTISYHVGENSGYGRLAVRYTDGSQVSVDAGNNNKDISYTTTAGKSVDYITADYSTGAGIFNISNIQIEQGDTATNYVPYSSQCHPTSCKNLWNPSDARSGNYSDVDGRATYADSPNYVTTATGIPVREGQKIKTITSKATQHWITAATSDNTVVERVQLLTGQTATYTVPAGAELIYPFFGGSGMALTLSDNIMVTKDTSATEYVPYNAACNGCDGGLVTYQSATGTVSQNGTPTPTNPIYPTFYKQGNMILRKIDDAYKDSYDASTGKITRKVGVKVLDGSENWDYYNVGYWGLQTYSNVDNSMVCSHFEYVSTNPSASNSDERNNKCYFLGGKISLGLYYGEYENRETFKQWLRDQYAAGTPVTVWYPLNTPVEETVGTTYCDLGIKVATKRYSDSKFSPVMTALNGAISTIKTVVTNTINQAAAVSALQTSKQTMPNASATNGTCPNYKQCLLVETSDGTPQWFVITDPFRDFVTPILATNTNGTTSTNDPGYQQVEYLQSSGRQYIDTGVVPNATQFGLNVKFKFDTKPNTGASFVAGSANSSNPLLWNSVLYLNDEIAIQYQQDGVTYNSIPFTTDVLDFSYSIADNVIITRINSVSNTDSCAVYNANNNSIYLFARHDTGAAMYGAVKIYSASLTSNNTLVRDFFPVRRLSDSALGMYDTVSKTFFPNAGDGDFTAGPDVTNDANVPSGPNWSVTWSNNGDNVAGTVYGEGVCNAVAGTYIVAATSANLSASGWSQSGASCWCKTTGATVNQESSSVSSAPWVFRDTYNSAASCASNCARNCEARVRANVSFRSAVFNAGS